MPDPLSVSAGVIGILSAAAHVSKKVFDFIQKTKDTPEQAQATLTEVSDVRGILLHCQTLINDTESSCSPGASLVLVEHVVVVLTGCLMTFSELETILEDLEAKDELDTINRMRWARKERDIAKILRKLQNQKISLGLMVTILGWWVITTNTALAPNRLIYETDVLNHSTNQAEVTQSVDDLKSMVAQILANHLELSNRMRTLETNPAITPQDEMLENDTQPSPSLAAEEEEEEEMTSIISALPEKQDAIPPSAFRATFDGDLESSRVYRRILGKSSGASIMTASTQRTPWSLLSGISLGDISTIAIVALPIFSSDLARRRHSDSMKPPVRFRPTHIAHFRLLEESITLHAIAFLGTAYQILDITTKLTRRITNQMRENRIQTKFRISYRTY